MNESFKQKAQNWLNTHVNQNWDTDGFPASQPYQCYDLAQIWAAALGASRFYGLYAADIITQPGDKWRRINNDASFVPQLGDLMVWNKNVGGGAGHVAVCTGEGDTNYFVSLDQNWSRPTATYVRHNYTNVIGVLRPLESEVANPAPPVPAPSADNEGIINGEGLRGRSEPNTNSTVVWVFNDGDRVYIISKVKGPTVTGGPYSPSDWWYQVKDGGVSTAPLVWISDAYTRTTKTPANVPDYAEASPPPPPASYTFNKDLECVTDVKPAAIGNFEAGNFPAHPLKAVIHDFGTRGVDTIGSLVNTFTKPGRGTSAHFAVSGKQIIQLVSLKDRAYHAGATGNDFVGIETDPVQDPDTIASARQVLKEYKAKYGTQLQLIKHSSLMNTACGDDVDLANYDITEKPPIENGNPLPDNPDYDKENNTLLKQLLSLVQWVVDKLKGVFK